ncbi:unnamed protein product, partial [Brassica rapa subsp. narinosa]
LQFSSPSSPGFQSSPSPRFSTPQAPDFQVPQALCFKSPQAPGVQTPQTLTVPPAFFLISFFLQSFILIVFLITFLYNGPSKTAFTFFLLQMHIVS